MTRNVIEWIIAIVVGVIIAILLSKFVVTKYNVHGSSMYPTFKDGDKLIINRMSKNLNTVKRGDVVIFHATQQRDYIKRLIGKPGDSVRYKKDQLYINGHKVKEPYLKSNKEATTQRYLTEDTDVSKMKHSGGKKRVPKGKYLVLGDNREVSIDSRRELGLVNKDRMVGKVMMRWAPLSEMRFKFYPHSFDEVN